MTVPPPARRWPLVLLAALVALGMMSHALGLVDARVALAWAQIHAAQWWFPAALVALQVLLLTVGLPGSAVLWVAAPRSQADGRTCRPPVAILAPVIHNPVRRQVIIAATLVAAVAILWLSAALQAAVFDALQLSKDYIARHPVASRAAFVALAACSAMLFLFSSVVLVPIAVHAWGQFETLVLLAAGWFVGGIVAYLVGRRFGRPAAEYFVAAPALDRCGRLLSARMSIVEVTLIKLALPSEVTSLALGIIRYPVHKLMLVLPASELPFAVWTVYLSVAFIEDRRLAFVLVLLAGLAAAGVVARQLLLRQR